MQESLSAFFVVDQDFVVSYLNRAAQELFALHAATFRRYRPEFDLASVEDSSIEWLFNDTGALSAALMEPGGSPYEAEIVRDGFAFRLRASGRFDQHQRLGYVIELTDLSELREHVRKAARLGRAIEYAQTPIMMVDRDLVVTYVNEATRDLLTTHEAVFASVWPGFEADGIVGSCIDRFHKNPEHQRSMLSDPKNLPHRADIQIEHMTFNLQVSGQFDGAGALVGHTLEWSDVTRLREKERESEQYRRQMDAVDKTLAIIRFKTDGTVIDANQQFIQAMGYELDEIVGQHHRLFCTPEVANSSDYEQLWSDLRAGRSQRREVERRNKSGEQIWLEATYTPVCDDDGRVYEVAKYAFDITEMTRTRQRVAAGVDQILTVVEAASRGDLSRTVPVRGNDPIGRLGEAFGGLLQALKSTLREVETSAGSLFAASNTMDTVSGRMQTDVQKATVESGQAREAIESVDSHIQAVSAAAKEMTASISEIASSATGAATVAQTAVGVAKEVQTSVSELGESSDEIGKVVKMITSIAQQTNLLALNATIEAARAGEAGRGFAVVANEVKELAKGTAKATQDIGQKIEAIRTATRSTIEAIQRVSVIIEEISEYQHTIASAVEEQNATTMEIGRSVQEAADRSQGIVTGMSTVEASFSSANEGAKMTRESSTELATMASSLRSLLSRFQLDGDGVRTDASYSTMAGVGSESRLN